jgi:hypothetical protein
MTSNSVDGSGTTAAYQLQDPAPAMTGQAAELHQGAWWNTLGYLVSHFLFSALPRWSTDGLPDKTRQFPASGFSG